MRATAVDYWMFRRKKLNDPHIRHLKQHSVPGVAAALPVCAVGDGLCFWEKHGKEERTCID